VIAVTDPNDSVTQANMSAKVGEPVEVSATIGSPGELLEVKLSGASIGSFCNATLEAHSECGA